MKPDLVPPSENESIEGISLVALYKAMLRIADHLDEQVAPSPKGEYTESMLRQTDELATRRSG